MLKTGPRRLPDAGRVASASAAVGVDSEASPFSEEQDETRRVARPQPVGDSEDGVGRKARARRFLGAVKFRVVDRWPYAILRSYGGRRRERWRSEILGLPPLPSSDGPHDMEIHMYCGAAQLDMGICASWSLMRFCDGARLYVHSDGTLSPDVFVRWQKVVPEAILISHAAADEKFMSELGEVFPALAKWRSGYWSARQVVDFHLFGSATTLVTVDSDVLCFRRPREIEDCCGGNGQAFRWNRNLSDHYSADRRLLESVTGLAVPEALNSGLLRMSSLHDRGLCVLGSHARGARGRVGRHISLGDGQTLYAAVAARYGYGEPFPSTYDVTLGRTRADVVTRHYVGLWSVRPRYFTEGVPRLLGELPDRSRSLVRS